MCTVSFLPRPNGGFVFTSNRDEAILRPTIEPKIYTINDIKVLFPKDMVAGGTWIGLSEKNRLVCLLNGGNEKHVRKDSYRCSRGVVVSDILLADNCVLAMENYNLNEIEPFTLIVLDWEKVLTIYELVWDENQRHLKELPIKPTIWSSSTLYSKNMKAKREEWFKSYFLDKEVSFENSLDFHENYGEGDKCIDLQISRGDLKTVSITSVIAEKNNDNVKMFYKDLLKNIEVKTFLKMSCNL